MMIMDEGELILLPGPVPARNAGAPLKSSTGRHYLVIPAPYDLSRSPEATVTARLCADAPGRVGWTMDVTEFYAELPKEQRKVTIRGTKLCVCGYAINGYVRPMWFDLGEINNHPDERARYAEEAEAARRRSLERWVGGGSRL